MKVRRRYLDSLVYLAIRTVICLIQCLSFDQAHALARLFARAVHAVDRRHRRVGFENLTTVLGPELTDSERRAIVRAVYEHFCMLVVELVLVQRKFHSGNWRRYVVLRDQGPVVERVLDHRPSLMLSGHYGNWEMTGYLLGLFGLRSHAVARVLDNPRLETYLKRFRQKTGQRIIPKKGGYEAMVDVLGRGESLMILADQDAGANGLFVEFFGRPASTHKAIALLAIEHDAPIVVGSARRVGPGFRYEVRSEGVFDPRDLASDGDPVRTLTQAYTSALERAIRRDLSQYLWLHRRWKHQPRPRGARRDAAHRLPSQSKSP